MDVGDMPSKLLWVQIRLEEFQIHYKYEDNADVKVEI